MVLIKAKSQSLRAKSATERVRAYRQRQADSGACNLSITLDLETREKLDAIVKIRGGRKGGGKNRSSP